MADREKVLKGLKCHVNGHPHSRCYNCPYWGTGPHGASECMTLARDALELLKEQPEQKRGHWKKDSQFSSVFCSKCGFPAIEQYICDSIPPKQYLSKYCPWCGAKMNEEVK